VPGNRKMSSRFAWTLCESNSIGFTSPQVIRNHEAPFQHLLRSREALFKLPCTRNNA